MAQKNRLIAFYRRHPVFVNLIAVIIAIIIVLWFIGVVFLGLWTRHGHIVIVPDVKGMPMQDAVSLLDGQGFEVKLDSIYDETVRPGTVIEQSPRNNSTAKKGRTVYLTYACYTAKLVKVPEYTNMSRRQAIAAFEEIGVSNIKVKEVPSEHADLVLGALYNGKRLIPGQKIPAGASIILEVGAGADEEYYSYPDDGDVYEELILPEDADAEYIEDLQQNVLQPDNQNFD